MAKTIKGRITPYQKTAAALAADNDVPLDGERVRETDTGREKTGNGTAHYNDLPYDGANLLGQVQAAKNPDLLVTGAVSLDGNDLITSADVVWPDGSPGTLSITSRDSNGAVLAYNITYGSPVTKTFTQPTITRNANGAVTNVPAIVVT